MKKINLSIFASSMVVTGALMLTGCGGGGGGSSTSGGTTSGGTTTQPQNERNVTVVDGYVIGATVTDCNGTSSTTNGSGIATAAFNMNCSLSSHGGIIDANNNGIADAGELSALDLHAPAGKDVISNLSELVFSGADENKLAQSLGVSVNDIYTDPIASNNITIAKAMQIAYVVEAAGKTNSFVSSINNFTESNTTNNNENYNEQNNSSLQSDLPNIGHYSIRSSDLPNIGHYDNDTSAGGNTSTDNNTSSNTATGSLETFANMAIALFDTNSTAATFIQAVLDLNETNASNIENAVSSNKASFASEFNMSGDTSTNTSGSGSTDTTTSGSGSTETTTSGSGSADTTTSGSGSTDTNTSESGSTDTNTSESGSTNSNSDLPQFSY